MRDNNLIFVVLQEAQSDQDAASSDVTAYRIAPGIAG
jgi:hypothetical protein